MSAQLKAGVIGLGLLGSQHTQFLDAQPEVEVTGVVDIREEVAQEIGDQVGAQFYTDYERMLKEQRLDIAVVATPDPLHKAPVLAAIEAGVPTIIEEKPMATTVSDAEEIWEAAEKAGARIFLCYFNRGSPMDRATYYAIQQGLLGEIVYGDVRLDDNICVPTHLWGERSWEPDHLFTTGKIRSPQGITITSAARPAAASAASMASPKSSKGTIPQH